MKLLTEPTGTWISFIHKHWYDDPDDLLLKYHQKDTPANLPINELTEQLTCYKKAAGKFPGIHQDGMLYTRRSLEQATGEAMLRYKSRKWRGSVAVDGTGGLGMDTFALSQNFERVLHIEPDDEIQEIARHNHRILGVADSIEYYNMTIEEWMSANNTAVDLLYLDPSRRAANQRYYSLEDSTPNITEIKEQLLNYSESVVIKLSPMFDADAVYNQLSETERIECCSVNTEVKEVLAELSRATTEPEIKAVLVDKTGSPREIINRKSKAAAERSFEAPFYLYQPDPAVIKAGAVESLAEEQNLTMVGNPGFYLVGNHLPASFPGKVYHIESYGRYQPKQIRKMLVNSGLDHIRIHRKNFPVCPEQLFKKLKISMGSQADLFLTRDNKNESVFFLCQPV